MFYRYLPPTEAGETFTRFDVLSLFATNGGRRDVNGFDVLSLFATYGGRRDVNGFDVLSLFATYGGKRDVY